MLQHRIRAAALLIAVSAVLPAVAQYGAKKGEWPTYGGDLGSTRYSPLDQISAANFNKLEVAFRFKTDALGPTPEYQFPGHAAYGGWRSLLYGRIAARRGGA